MTDPTKLMPSPASAPATSRNGLEPRGARHVGVVGLAVMGENLARNIARNGFAPIVYNRTASRTDEFMADAGTGTGIAAAYAVPDFVAGLARPRRIILMVKAGAPVDAVIAELEPYLEAGDILIDGGNSFFSDTERRCKDLTGKGFHFVGMGVSGGEEGALWGPSLMPGGPPEAYRELESMLTAISAKTEAGPCVTHIGPGGSGHYVKMVHNGIEYGDMQLIAETYDVMRRALGMSAPDIAEVFAGWNEGRLASYLIQITTAVLRFKDADTHQPLVDVIADQAEQKGTGRWTSQNALELATPIPTIDAAVMARSMSALKEKRVYASTILHGPEHNGAEPNAPDRARLLTALEAALYFAKISSYAQGMALLRAASEAYSYGLNLAEIARIWKGGCIIRAALLDPIRSAFGDDPDLDNLLLAPVFADVINETMPSVREVLGVARSFGMPIPGLSASLDYVDTYRQEFLPANLIQGQRDFFGAHTYMRLDKPGTFHTVWTPAGTPETVASEPSRRRAWSGGEGEGDRSPMRSDHPPGTDPAMVEPEMERPAPDEPRPDAEERGAKTPEAARESEY